MRSRQSAEIELRSALPGPPVFSTSDSNWKEQVREALGGHKLEVAFDAIGGKAIDDLAEVVDDGGTIINFGSLGSNMGTNIYSLVPNNVALKSVSIMGWFRLTEDEKQKDFELALSSQQIIQSFSRSRMSMSLGIFKKQFSTSLVREKPESSC